MSARSSETCVAGIRGRLKKQISLVSVCHISLPCVLRAVSLAGSRWREFVFEGGRGVFLGEVEIDEAVCALFLHLCLVIFTTTTSRLGDLVSSWFDHFLMYLCLSSQDFGLLLWILA